MSEQDATEQITGAQSLIRSLERAGAENIFGIPGGAILPATARGKFTQSMKSSPNATGWPGMH